MPGVGITDALPLITSRLISYFDVEISSVLRSETFSTKRTKRLIGRLEGKYPRRAHSGDPNAIQTRVRHLRLTAFTTPESAITVPRTIGLITRLPHSAIFFTPVIHQLSYDKMVSTCTKTYTLVAMPARTSRKSLLQEVAEVGASFDGQNEAEVLTAEGELQSGTLPAVDQHALSVAQSPRSQNDDEEEMAKADSQDTDSGASSDELDEGFDSLCTPNNVDWSNDEDGFIVPRIVAKKNSLCLVSDGMDTEYKFFPSWFDLSKDEDQQIDSIPKVSWFDLSEDEDQLGPIPQEWLKQEDTNLQDAIFASIVEGGRKRKTGPVRSAAVIVEVLEKPAESKQSKRPAAGKGKGIGAGERSAGFAAYLHRMQAEGSKKHQKDKKAPNAKKAGKSGKSTFMRPDSQVPEGGWFKATTSKSGSPPAPPNTPDPPSSDNSSSSERSSSDSDDSSSEDPDSSSSESSSDSDSDEKPKRRKATSRKKDRACHRAKEMKKSSLEKLEKWAVRFEKSKEVLDREKADWKPKPEGRSWGRFKNRTRGNEPWKPQSGDDEPAKHNGKTEQSGKKNTNKPAKNGQHPGKQNPDKSKEKSKDKRLSPEEMDKMRAEDRCFTCKDVGHQSRNCPEKHQAKAPHQKVSVGATRYDYLKSLNMDELAKESREASIHFNSVRVEDEDHIDDEDQLPDPATLEKGTDKVWLHAPAVETRQ
ncbi:hypothetical protein B0H13DRAFT_1890088 [Mycena leptocephala]|nr:hypothetical protein B0H13DRAFT_1890088 [Mycena leptocephala]